MRNVLVAAALLFAVAASAESSAFTGELNELRGVLETRLTALSGQSDAQSRARTRALAAALKKIDRKDSTSVAGDVSIVSAISGTIEKVFGANDTDLATTYDGILATALGVRSRTEDGIARVADTAARARLTALLAKADPFLATAQLMTGPSATVTIRAHALKAAMTRIDAVSVKAQKAHDACGPGVVDEFGGEIGGAPFDPPAREARLEIGADGGVTSLVVRGIAADGEAMSFTIYGAFLHGRGAYPVKRRLVNGDLTPVALADWRKEGVFVCDDATGTLDLTTYDRKGHRVAGTFDVTFTTHGMATPDVSEVRHAAGSFRLCGLVENRQ